MSVKFIDEKWSWKNTTLYEFLQGGNYPQSDPKWKAFFEANMDDLKKISQEITEEAQGATIYPPIYQTFRAFLPLEKVRVVILGQDPYHNGSAIGLCFSVKPGNAINQSLRSIYKELEDEGFPVTRNGDLTHWEKQGCMLLNTALTVERSNAGAHVGIWYDFMEKVIQYIDQNTKGVAWLLMGKKALVFSPNITGKKFITSHPMPLSAGKSTKGSPAFFGSDVFKGINKYLVSKQKKPVEW